MKAKLQYYWNVQFYYEPGCPVLKTTMPTQVKACSFDEAKSKVESFLIDMGNDDKIKVSGLQLAGAAYLE